MDRVVWRLGRRPEPLDFVPREHASWLHRFDDPLRVYRTLYCAASPLTCLREVLADLRPNARVLAEIDALFGPAPGVRSAAGAVSRAWLETHVLCPARIEADGPVVDLDDVPLRERLKRDLAPLLADYGMEQLDIPEVRSRARAVTQAISRMLYAEGAAVIRFRSRLDDEPCFCLLEGRARLVGAGEPVELSQEARELERVCAEYGLAVDE